MNTYANSKLIDGLWIATLAKEHPNVYFASVSRRLSSSTRRRALG